MQQLLDPGDLISGSWQNFTRNFRTYAEFSVWYALLAVVQWGLVVVCRGMFTDVLLLNVAISIVNLPVAVCFAAVMVALIYVTNQGVTGKPVSALGAFSLGLHRVIPFIWVMFLVTLTYIGGLLLFVIPLFIFAVWFWFSQFFTVIDDVRGTAAMSASRRLVSGRWWPVAMRILLPAVFFIVAATFVRRVVFLLIGFALGEPATFNDQYLLTNSITNSQLLIVTVVPTVINSLLFALLYGSYLMLWNDLKRTK